MTEEKLLHRARKGDEAAFEELVRTHEKRIYAVCFRLLRNEEDALDAAQETFFAAWRGLGSFRGEAAFATWLTRLATNACLDMLRKRKRRPETLSLDAEDAPPPTADGDTPEEAAQRSELSAQVRSALQMLPPHYREILVLREIEELRYEEIALRLHLDPGTVRSRLSRAREKLREILLAQGNFFPPPASKKVEKEGCK